MAVCRARRRFAPGASTSPPSSLHSCAPVSPFLTPSRIAVACLAVGLVVAPAAPLAQVRTDARGTRITEPPSAPVSRWQAERDALDQAVRSRASTATTPRERWIDATWGDADPWARAEMLADARIRMPDEKVFMASLAIACLAPLQPLPAACDATDRLADWALRDADNGVLTLLLADRARQRNNVTAMIAYLDEAVAKARFDDYADRAALLLWEAIRDVPGTVDPAARVELAIDYGRAHVSYSARQIANLCRDPAALPDGGGAACRAAGDALAGRGATWALRGAGAQLAERSADPGTRAAARQQASTVQRRAYDCAESSNVDVADLQAADVTARARAVAQWEVRLRQAAQRGQAAVCPAG